MYGGEEEGGGGGAEGQREMVMKLRRRLSASLTLLCKNLEQ